MIEPSPAPSVLPSTADVEVQNVRRDRAMAWLRLLGSFAMLIGGPWALKALGEPSLVVFAIFGGLALYLWAAGRLAGTDRGPGERRLAPADVRIEGGDLVVVPESTHGSGERLPLSSLTGGWTEPAAEGCTAVLTFSDSRVVAIAASSEEKAVELLTTAGAGAQARAVRMRTYREDASGRKIAGALLAFFALIAIPMVIAVPIIAIAGIPAGSRHMLALLPGFLVGVAPFVALMAWLRSKVVPTWVHIGTDGVMLRGAFRRRFLPHRAITGAMHTRGGVGDAYHFVKLAADGKHYTVPVASEAEAEALMGRIQAAPSATSAQDRARLLDVIARNGRPVAEWRKALEALVSKSGYRSAGHDVEEVMRIVEDGAAPLEQRVAAALAARPHGGEAVQSRIRVAAEACVEPRLRIALERAAAGELKEAELEEIAAREASAG